jgi:lipopolysaccharide export system permease protein
LRLLDRYVVKTFFTVFVMALIVFSISIVTLDFFGRVSEFMDEDAVAGEFAGASKMKLIFLFYVAYLPYVLKDVLAFVSVAAGMFTVTHMLRNNEVQPVLAAGVSARRLFLPVFLCGLVVVAGHIAFQELVVPSLNKEFIALKRFFAGDKSPELRDVPHLRDGRGTVTRAATYSFADRSLTGVVVARPWTDAGFEAWFVDKLEPDGDTWRAATPVLIQPAAVGAAGVTLDAGVPVDFGVSPDEVDALASKHGTAELSLRQLRALAKKYPDRRSLHVSVQRQLARPMASFVLLLLGIPLLLSMGRSLVAGAAVAFTISSTFYFIDIFLTSIANRGDLPAVLAVWFPIVLFFSLGLARLATLQT